MDGINGNEVESMELMGEWMLWMGMSEFQGWTGMDGMDGIVIMEWMGL